MKIDHAAGPREDNSKELLLKRNCTVLKPQLCVLLNPLFNVDLSGLLRLFTQHVIKPVGSCIQSKLCLPFKHLFQGLMIYFSSCNIWQHFP